MARPLRIWVAGGWYHLTARGNRQETTFRTDVDRRRFVGLLADMVERFGVKLHVFGKGSVRGQSRLVRGQSRLL